MKQRIQQHLNANHIRFELIAHPTAFTAQEVARAAHVSGWQLAKTVMVRLDGQMAMAVLPAPVKLDLEMLREASGASKVELADEDSFREMFPECETGAMPPLGSLYDMKVYVDDTLKYDEHIAFNAGTHTELVRIRYDEFERLERPVIAPLAIHAAI